MTAHAHLRLAPLAVTGIHLRTWPGYSGGMVASDPVTPEPHRFAIRLPRPLWIGLMTLLLVIVAAGFRIGLPIYRQQAAIREIEERGGYVKSYDDIRIWDMPDWMLRMWWRLYLIESERVVFREVHLVDLSGGQFDDDVLPVTLAFPQVRHLDLTLSGVTDAGMPHLAALGCMETLFLSGTGVTDAGLVHLKSLKKLRNLYLVSTAITDDGINDLKAALPSMTIQR
jgi:8-oxo-dGTP pyrophosphatase MutT (NUDIX family)